MDTPIEPRPSTPRRTPRLVADRSIDDLRFGAEWEPKLGTIMLNYPHDDSEFIAAEGVAEDVIAAERELWRKRAAELPTDRALVAWEEVHASKIARLHALFAKCNIKTASDIDACGCTGATVHGLSLSDVQFLRLALAGSGVGLPCFVPPDRYCLAHEVSGGLQEGQDSLFPEAAKSISRELSPSERTHGRLVEEVRQGAEGSNEARRMLRGRQLPQGWEAAEGGAQVESAEPSFRDIRDEQYEPLLGIDPIKDVRQAFQAGRAASWKCPDHNKTNWSCRYCVAQAIVEGELEPVYRLAVGTKAGDRIQVTDMCPGGKLAQEIADEDAQGTTGLDVYVRVATFTHKLSRDNT